MTLVLLKKRCPDYCDNFTLAKAGYHKKLDWTMCAKCKLSENNNQETVIPVVE